MAYSTNQFTYAGGAQTFTLSLGLGYLEEADIAVYVVGELDGSSNQIYRTFTFDSEFVVRVTESLDVDDEVVVERTVSKTAFEVDFETGGSVTGRNLMIQFKQQFMLMQELLDGRIDGTDVTAQATIAAAGAVSANTSAIAALASEVAAAASAASINLTDYVKKDGSVDFTAVQVGITPVLAAHLATKDYVDGAGAGAAWLLDGSVAMTGLAKLKVGTSPTHDDHAAPKKYVDDQIVAGIAPKAPLASPTLTGTPAAPTAAPSTDTTQIATTEYVQAEIAALPSVGLAWTFVENVYDFGGDGILASAETSNFVDGFEYMLDFNSWSNNDGGQARGTIDFYGETAAAYQGERWAAANLNSSATPSGFLFLPTVRSSLAVHFVTGAMQRDNDDLDNQWSGTWIMAAQKVLKAKIAFDTSSMDGGTVKLYKRAL